MQVVNELGPLEQSNNRQAKNEAVDAIGYTAYSNFASENAYQRLVDENDCGKMAVSDAGVLIDLVSKLQNIHHSNYIRPLLLELEKLLKIKNTSLGVYNSKSKKISHIVGTNEKGLPPLIKSLSSDIAGSHVFHSKYGISMAFFEHKSQGDLFTSYIYFESKSRLLEGRQKQLLTFALPYLYAIARKLHYISKTYIDLNLTRREQEVMEWIKVGKDNWAISKILGISERTIKFHNCNICKKLGVNSKAEVICWYYQFVASLKTWR